jgi:septal ring factor EnvC (AmiA/AmiB activator)
MENTEPIKKWNTPDLIKYTAIGFLIVVIIVLIIVIWQLLEEKTKIQSTCSQSKGLSAAEIKKVNLDLSKLKTENTTLAAQLLKLKSDFKAAESSLAENITQKNACMQQLNNLTIKHANLTSIVKKVTDYIKARERPLVYVKPQEEIDYGKLNALNVEHSIDTLYWNTMKILDQLDDCQKMMDDYWKAQQEIAATVTEQFHRQKEEIGKLQTRLQNAEYYVQMCAVSMEKTKEYQDQADKFIDHCQGIYNRGFASGQITEVL